MRYVGEGERTHSTLLGKLSNKQSKTKTKTKHQAPNNKHQIPHHIFPHSAVRAQVLLAAGSEVVDDCLEVGPGEGVELEGVVALAAEDSQAGGGKSSRVVQVLQHVVEQVAVGADLDALKVGALAEVVDGAGTKVVQLDRPGPPRRRVLPHHDVVAVEVAVHDAQLVQVVTGDGDAVGHGEDERVGELGAEDVARDRGKGGRAGQRVEALRGLHDQSQARLPHHADGLRHAGRRPRHQRRHDLVLGHAVSRHLVEDLHHHFARLVVEAVDPRLALCRRTVPLQLDALGVVLRACVGIGVRLVGRRLLAEALLRVAEADEPGLVDAAAGALAELAAEGESLQCCYGDDPTSVFTAALTSGAAAQRL
eukprot:m.83418 g.83418  ORF g.83418 m.83418 type:complete len:365 (-) comp14972_c2_seq1:25-1119(-)